MKLFELQKEIAKRLDPNLNFKDSIVDIILDILNSRNDVDFFDIADLIKQDKTLSDWIKQEFADKKMFRKNDTHKHTDLSTMFD